MRDGKKIRWAPSKASRFITEIPSELFEKSHSTSFSASTGQKKFWNPSSKKKTNASPSWNQFEGLYSKKETKSENTSSNEPPGEASYTKKPESAAEFKTGVWVSHSKYGRGKILSRSGSSNNLKLKIQFDHYGVKNMIARYAPLEIIVY